MIYKSLYLLIASPYLSPHTFPFPSVTTSFFLDICAFVYVLLDTFFV